MLIFTTTSILDFDAGVGQIIDRLTALGIYDNTILIIGTDHSQAYFTTQRIPLIIHFPANQYEKPSRPMAATWISPRPCWRICRWRYRPGWKALLAEMARRLSGRSLGWGWARKSKSRRASGH